MSSSAVNNGLIALSTVTLASIVLAYVNWKNNLHKGFVTKSKDPKYAKPADCKWIDQDSFHVLSAICDAIIPRFTESDLTEENLARELNELCPELLSSGLLKASDLLGDTSALTRGAIESDVHILFATAVQELTSEKDQKEIGFLLKLLSTSAGSALLTGIPAPFHHLPLESRVRSVQRLRDSSFAQLRAAYQTFKRVTGNVFLSFASRGSTNPAWSIIGHNPVKTVSKQAIDYDREKEYAESADAAAAGHTRNCSQDTELAADVVIVGSGMGGGLMASELVKAGLNVIVLEKGGYYDQQQFQTWREPEAMAKAFERGGLCTSADGNIIVLAGACVGGGTTINWSASFRTPQFILDEWAIKLGLDEFKKGGSFEKSLDAVHSLMKVNTDNSFRLREEGQTAACTDQPDSEPELQSQCGHHHSHSEQSQSQSPDATFAVNRNNQLLWEGAEKLGYQPEAIPRNAVGCVDCGHCCFGCPYGAKQSTVHAFMAPILSQQAQDQHGSSQQSSSSSSSSSCSGAGGCKKGTLRVIANCYAHKVLTKMVGNEMVAVGVEATVNTFDQENIWPTKPAPTSSRKLVVTARVVVASAGAIHTPALLLRSGLLNRKIGKHLTLHPVLAAAGYFPGQSTGLASGVSMGVVVRSPSIEARPGYPVAIETPPVHPGMLGLIMPWSSGLAFKATCLLWKNLAAFIAISRDESCESNCISLNPSTGEPIINYQLTANDKPMVLNGLVTQLRVLHAAGAALLFPIHEKFKWFVTANSSAAAKSDSQHASHSFSGPDVKFESYLKEVQREGVVPMRMQVFSAHQMSSCRMASTPAQGPVSPSGETWECKKLFVADASNFPTSLGINPMLTIAAMTHMISRNIMCSLGATVHEDSDAHESHSF